jgi:hypothetical protein
MHSHPSYEIANKGFFVAFDLLTRAFFVLGQQLPFTEVESRAYHDRQVWFQLADNQVEIFTTSCSSPSGGVT